MKITLSAVVLVVMLAWNSNLNLCSESTPCKPAWQGTTLAGLPIPVPVPPDPVG